MAILNNLFVAFCINIIISLIGLIGMCYTQNNYENVKMKDRTKSFIGEMQFENRISLQADESFGNMKRKCKYNQKLLSIILTNVTTSSTTKLNYQNKTTLDIFNITSAFDQIIASITISDDTVNHTTSTSICTTGTIFELKKIASEDDNLKFGFVFVLVDGVEVFRNNLDDLQLNRIIKLSKPLKNPNLILTEMDQWQFTSIPQNNSNWSNSFEDNNWITLSMSDIPCDKSITTYFRNYFILPNRNSTSFLSITVKYRDGFVLYINGFEIIRRNIYNTFNSYQQFNELYWYRISQIGIKPSI